MSELTEVQFCKNCLSCRYTIRGRSWEGYYELERLGFIDQRSYEEGMMEAVCSRCGGEEFMVVWTSENIEGIIESALQRYRLDSRDHFEDVALAAVLLASAGKGGAELRQYDFLSDLWVGEDFEDFEDLLSRAPKQQLERAKRALLGILL